MDIRIKVGKRIRQLRRNREMTQLDVVKLCGISRTHLSDLENGLREVCLLTLEKLAKAFNVPPSELLK